MLKLRFLSVHTHMVVASVLTLGLLTASEALAQNGAQDGAADGGQTAQSDEQVNQLWTDFNHYVLIARPDMAKASAQALLEQANNASLLNAVESGSYDDWQQNLDRAQGISDMREVAERLEQRIQTARIERARDEQRIANNIELLDDGRRPFRNATQRLAGAGQYAVPQMLATLENTDKGDLHPYVIESLVTIGRPVVYPLAEALPQLDEVTQAQVGRVLGRIGYPRAMAQIKDVLETQDPNPETRRTLERAYQMLLESSQASAGMSAADLYLGLARDHYDAGTRGDRLPSYDSAQDQGIVWEYASDVGLVPVPVPGEIHADVLAMRSARRALELDSSMDSALSRYLMANLRRANRLPEGAMDRSYDESMHDPAFYAKLAGPRRLHDVLARALADRDPELALDAIEGLSQTAGTEALMNLDAATQPLLDALNYPDRRVRFRAAEALANARPAEEFPNADRVVPVLAEAIRKPGVKYAIVLADDQDTLNQRLADVRELGYEVIGGITVTGVAHELGNYPGMDLVVLDKAVDSTVSTFQQTREHYKLSSTPVVAIASQTEQYQLEARVGQSPRFSMTAADGDGALSTAVQQAAQSYAGQTFSDQQMTDFALTAMDKLRDIALASDVYEIELAQSALVTALDDERAEVARAAAAVVAILDNAEAQRALAQRALNGSGQMQIVMLQSLADSATHYGNMLEPRQIDQLNEMVQTSSGDQALAASRAHGALNLPTSRAVDMILGSGGSQ